MTWEKRENAKDERAKFAKYKGYRAFLCNLPPFAFFASTRLETELSAKKFGRRGWRLVLLYFFAFCFRYCLYFDALRFVGIGNVFDNLSHRGYNFDLFIDGLNGNDRIGLLYLGRL
jgi:hypothetical protein